jgi:hypothetical protein
MQKAITCINCGEVVAANPCLKGDQSYCNKKACQNARKLAWYHAKIASDSEYAERQEQCKRRWRKNKPAHKYQNHYRQTHPDYVKQNREQQQERNRTYRLLTKESASQTIVKIDALSSTSSSIKKPNIYEMKILTPNVLPKIVKIDTLIVQIQPCQFTGSGVVP